MEASRSCSTLARPSAVGVRRTPAISAANETLRINPGLSANRRAALAALLAADRGGDREQLDVGSRDRAVAAHADALDDRARGSRAPGDSAGADLPREGDLHGRRVAEDLHVARPRELRDAV